MPRRRPAPIRLRAAEVDGPDDDYDVLIAARAKGDSLVVRELRDVKVRTTSSPSLERLHFATRIGLPEKLVPGSYGPFEASLRVGARLPRPLAAPAASAKPKKRRGR